MQKGCKIVGKGKMRRYMKGGKFVKKSKCV